ncbi:MAG: winged helix-turn-helix domain-containing protein [Acidobacteriota bacterium]|nr:winged helix-turn-helix domain-containing protein [Acidobacteriota bacterium]
MAYPVIERIELPILQELVATGGVEDVRFLYDRLVAYFPQMTEKDVHPLRNGHRDGWRRIVQRAGRALDDQRLIERHRGHWVITSAGRKRAAEEATQFSLTQTAESAAGDLATFTHVEAQQMLLDVGRVLGYHAQMEFEYYDVVWREGEASPRLSHVFEVQRRGNIDSALAKLKHAYDAQRSKPYLIVAGEHDTGRARKHLSEARAGAFHEIGRVTTIFSFAELRRLHRALTSVEDILAGIFE